MPFPFNGLGLWLRAGAPFFIGGDYMTLKYILALSLALILSLSALSPSVGAEEQPTESESETDNPYDYLNYEQWQSLSYSEKYYFISLRTSTYLSDVIHWTYSKTIDKLDEYSYEFYKFVNDPENEILPLMSLFPTNDPPYTVDPDEFEDWLQEHHSGGGYSGGTHGGGGGGGVRPDPADVAEVENRERQNEYYAALLGFHTGEQSINLQNGFVFKEKHRVTESSTGEEIGDEFDFTADNSNPGLSIRVDRGIDIYFNDVLIETKWFNVWYSGSQIKKFSYDDSCGGFKLINNTIYYDASFKYTYYTWKLWPSAWRSSPDELAASTAQRLYDVTTYVTYNDQDYSDLPQFTPLTIDRTPIDYDGQYGFDDEDDPSKADENLVAQNNEIIGWLKKIYERQQAQQVAIVGEIARGNNLLSTLNNTLNNQFNRLYNLLNKGSGNTTNNEGDENNLNLDVDLSLFDDLISIATEIKSAEDTEDNSIKVTFYNQKKELFRKLGVPTIIRNINKVSNAFWSTDIISYSDGGENENPSFTMPSNSGGSSGGSVPDLRFTVFGAECNLTELWDECIDPVMPTVREIFSFFIILGVIVMWWKALPGIIGNVGYIMGFSSDPVSDPDPVGSHEKPQVFAVDDDGEVREMNRIGSIFGKSTWQFKR